MFYCRVLLSRLSCFSFRLTPSGIVQLILRVPGVYVSSIRKAGFSVGNCGDLCGNLQVIGSVDLIWKPERRRTLWDSMYIVVYIVYKRWGFYYLKRHLKVL